MSFFPPARQRPFWPATPRARGAKTKPRVRETHGQCQTHYKRAPIPGAAKTFPPHLLVSRLTMQFFTAALFAAVAVATVVTETDTASTLVTVTSCGSTVTDCPAEATSSAVAVSSSAANSTVAAVSSYEAGANKHVAAGAVALAAGALLAL